MYLFANAHACGCNRMLPHNHAYASMCRQLLLRICVKARRYHQRRHAARSQLQPACLCKLMHALVQMQRYIYVYNRQNCIRTQVTKQASKQASAHVRTFVRTNVRACLHSCMHTTMQTCVRACLHTCMHERARIHAFE